MGKWKRRAFIGTGILASGVVIFGVAVRPGNRAEKVRKLIAGAEDAVFNVWVKIAPDNTITAIIPHAEMGQGVHTSLAMMLAEELDADWSQLKIEEAPADKEYANYALIKGFLAGDKNIPAWLMGTLDGTALTLGKQMDLQITGGSTSVRFTGRQGMAVAGAATREMLVEAAADEWSVPASEIVTEKSTLSHKSGKKALYSELAPAAALLSMPSKPSLKKAKDYKILGTSPQRSDIPAKVDGSSLFGIDVQLPGMKYAAVKSAPVFGSKVLNIDDSQLSEVNGVQKVVKLESAVAVIADGYWQAKQGLARLKISWEKTDYDGLSQNDLLKDYSIKLDDMQAGGKKKKDYKNGNAEKALSGAETILEAEYKVPFLAHATMEPMNCTAWVKDGSCEIWAGSQNPLGFQSAVAKALDISKKKVTVNNHMLGGGFGRRSENDVPVMAAMIAKEVDYPVKMIWSREEDMRQDVYREATISRFKAGLDKDGKPVAYTNQYLVKHHPEEASVVPYSIDHTAVHFANVVTHVPWGNWRSVDHTVHGFTIESFIDEMAVAAGKDAYEFRKSLLEDKPKLMKVLDLAAEKADWGRALPENWGRGISLQESFGTIVAEVVEVEVADGEVKVHRVVCAADPGFAVHPDGFKAQIESGVIYGLTAALYGEISIKNGAVVQSNFHDYPILRMAETPKIETHIINSGDRLGGGGEPGTPGIAPALANAVYNAIGVRVRSLPFSKIDLERKPMLG